MNIINSFTRKEALETGELVDATKLAKEAGVKFPTALTRLLWEDLIVPDEIAFKRGETISDRLWYVLFMFTFAARKSEGNTVNFPVCCTKNGETKVFTL